MPLRVVIVEDEEPARVLLAEYLSRHEDVKVVATCANGFEAVKAVSNTNPDLLLLDIQMPKLDGFEVLELIEREIPVIFITAFDEHAVRAFDVHAVDYLLKPFDPERLDEALDRARRRIEEQVVPAIAEIVAAARRGRSHATRILVREKADVHVIPVADVDYIEARDDYVCVKAHKKEHLKKARLSDLEKQLDAARFVKIHRSYLLNIDRLAHIETYAKDSRVAILADGSRLPVSRSGYARLSKLL